MGPAGDKCFPAVFLLPLQAPRGVLRNTQGWGSACLDCFRPVLLSSRAGRPLVSWGDGWWAGLQGTPFPPDSSINWKHIWSSQQGQERSWLCLAGTVASAGSSLSAFEGLLPPTSRKG